MLTDRIKRLGIIFNPKFIILFYLGSFNSVFAYSVLVRKQSDMILIYARLGFLITYSVLAILAFRGKKVAIWIIAVYILLSGLGGLIGLLMSTSQWLLKAVYSLLGAYFVCAAFFLTRKRNSEQRSVGG